MIIPEIFNNFIILFGRSTVVRRLFVGLLFLVMASGLAFASFPETRNIIYYLIDPYDIDKGFNEDFKKIIGDQYWLMSYPFNSSQKYMTDHVTDPYGKSMKGQYVPAGSSVDKAWTIETGDPGIIIAIIDTGIQWDKTGLVNKLYLNRGELENYPPGLDAKGNPIFDFNNDHAFNMQDYVDAIQSYYKEKAKGSMAKNKVLDNLISAYDRWCKAYTGHWQSNFITDYELKHPNEKFTGVIPDPPYTPQQLIMAFSDGSDDDLNGYMDDICGWDFFANDNDADDVSSYTSTARYHGTGQSFAAGGEFYDNPELINEIGACPDCTIMPLKAWDSFVQDTNYYGQAVFYAAYNGAHVIEGALGGLNNSGLCRDAVEYAYKKGMAIFMVSSDINSANHNWPTYLNEPMYCTGMVPDTYIEGVIPSGVNTWFRNSGLCQFGAKNHISFEVSSGSHSTALSSGAGGLLISLAKHKAEQGEIGQYRKADGKAFDNGMPLHPDQIKQLLTMTAEDVVPEDTQGTGSPDPSQVGWDQHFGYGRVNLFWAAELLGGVKDKDGKVLHPPAVPPVARITAPQWSQYLDPGKDSLELRGDVLFAGTAGTKWIIEAGYGVEPTEGSFKPIGKEGSEQGENIDFGGPVNLAELKSKIIPAGLDLGYYPKEPDTTYRGNANIQANRHMFTIRLRVLDKKGKRLAEDRRTFFMCEDKNLHQGWPKFIGVGGEAAPRLEDLDGDNLKEVLIATSDGRILIYKHDGTPFKYKGNVIELASDDIEFDRKNRVNLGPIRNDVHNSLGRWPALRPSFVTPAVADIDNDGLKEIVGVAGRYMYCFKLDGTTLFKRNFGDINGDNFTKDVEEGKVFNADHDPEYPGYSNANSTENPISPGAMAPPVLFDINNDGFKEIIVAAGDQRIYAWDKDGRMCSGWPVYARAYEKSGGKIIYSPCVADLDGDGRPELVVSTNEVIGTDDSTPVVTGEQKSILNRVRSAMLGKRVLADSRAALPGGPILASTLDAITNVAGKDCLVYAIKAEGNGDFSDGGRYYKASRNSFVKGWPVSLKALLPDILPHLGPSTKPAAFDYDNDGADEIVANATSAQTAIIDGDGRIINKMKRSPMGDKAKAYLDDKSVSLDLYDSVALGNLDKDDSIEIAQGGLSLFGALNLFIAGQNFPFNHVMQVWDSKTGSFEDAYPRPVDDFILYAEPAIADVDGDGVNEVLTGSGLYLLHALGMDGLDRGVFPKLSAGWIMMSPAVSDIDGDGKNEVAAVTREGGIFIWDTDGQYTADSKGKPATWPTFGHDNCNTSNLGYDATAPAGITEYEWTPEGLTFRCPGDDGFNGRAREIKVLGYTSPINVGNREQASVLKTITNPASGGQLVYVDIPDDYAHYAVIARDDAGNTTQLMIEGGPLSKEEAKASGEASSDNSGGGSSGICFISTAAGI
jgi:hypothetical protein